MEFLLPGWSLSRLIPVLGFVILALALILFYFSAMRPRRGTTEWMSRLDRPRFSALRCSRLRPMDALWGLLAALAGAGAAMLTASGFAGDVSLLLRWQTLLPAGISAAFYLSLRLLCADALTAALSAALLPAMLPDPPLPAAIVVLSLLLLLLWLERDPEKDLFPAGMLLPVFTLLFGAAVLLEKRLFWLAPVYVGAYLFAQLQRWHFSERYRGKRLLLSLVLTVLTVAACALALYAGRFLPAGFTGGKDFFRGFFRRTEDSLAALCAGIGPVRLQWRDCLLLLYAAAAVFPVLHGAIRRRELRCLAMLLLPLPFFALWLFGGINLLPLALLPLPAWTLTTLGRRWRGAEILCAVAMPLFYLMELWIP